MAGFHERLEAAADLAIGIVVVAQRAHHGRLIGQVAFRRARFGGTVHTAPGTGVRLGDHGDGSDAGLRPDPVEGENPLHPFIWLPQAVRDLLPIAGEERVVADEGAAGLGGDVRLEFAQRPAVGGERVSDLIEQLPDGVHSVILGKS